MGKVSRFQALSTTLSVAIGAGNITGVATVPRPWATPRRARSCPTGWSTRRWSHSAPRRHRLM
ncbi:MAG: alanine:cation symporter family protein [Gammaproteobacteria bacterium]|nr:alanine:cation symporter family protein [Gammaproteobacteria bacterium]